MSALFCKRTWHGRPVTRDCDLAALLEVETRSLVRRVRNNLGLFPPGSVQHIGGSEFDLFRKENAAPVGHGGKRHPPWIFTQEGVLTCFALYREAYPGGQPPIHPYINVTFPVVSPRGLKSKDRLNTVARDLFTRSNGRRGGMYVVQDHSALMDMDVASGLGISTKGLNQILKRNADLFPETYAFSLTSADFAAFKDKHGLNQGHQFKKNPIFYTTRGGVMMSFLLRTPQAMELRNRAIREMAEKAVAISASLFGYDKEGPR